MWNQMLPDSRTVVSIIVARLNIGQCLQIILKQEWKRLAALTGYGYFVLFIIFEQLFPLFYMFEIE